ncbi:MAG: amino acid adenylation domain-containing protein, partial [Methylobacter sp.]
MQKTNELSNRRAHLSETKQAMLEQLLKGKVKAGTSGDIIQPRPESAAPLSCSQQRLFFLDHLQSLAVAYNMPAALQLKGTLCLAALEQALDEIVRRHEVLRTVFVQEGKQIRQKMTPVLNLACPVAELNDLPDELRQQETQRLHQQELHKPFDLAQGPLLRVNLIQQAADRYLLLFTLHHIISDGWSIGILIREFSELYRAFIDGRPSPLSELPIQYADFAYWQKQWLQSAAYEKQLAYWQRQLQGAPDTLALPTDRSRPAQPSHRGANYHFSVPDTLSAQLNSLSRRHGVSVFTTLLSAFNVLLYRYTAQHDICIGTPVANRNRQELEGLIGFFVNTLVLRSDLSGNPAFSGLLKQTGNRVLEAQANQDLPFDKLVEAVSGVRDLNQTPLFQVLFVMQNTPSETFSLPGLELMQGNAETQTAKFDLTLLLTETNAGLQAVFEYNTDLFEQATMQRWSEHYLNLLQAIVSRPDRRIADLPLLSPAENRQILLDWNATQVRFPQDRWIHQLFEQQVEVTPDAVAVIFEQRFLSYAELNIRANQLAHYLQGGGIGPDVRVGVCMERSLELVIALLAVLKAGGAYVPLDPGYPQERLDFMLSDVNAPVVLTQSPLLSKFAASSAKLLCLDTQWPELAGEAVVNPEVALLPEHLAYCIYTSGSTGKPKGADVPHQGILNRLQWMQAEYKLDSDDRVLQKTPFSFDVSVWEFFWPLMTGATLVVAAPEQHKDSRALIELIKRQRVTTLHFVPSMLQAFLDTPGVETCTSLTRVICSGEALSAELVRRFYQHSGAKLHNLYGPTEASVDVSYWACRPDTGDAVPIGKPIANIELYILDRQLKPVPVGIPGELHIGGTGLARGYLNRAELSAEKFIPNPFCASGGRLYKTGDLSRFRADGNIEYLGRIDHQVKIRGFRIELGEIEARLQEHAGIKEAAVLAREDLPGDKRLVAYIVAAKPDVNTEQLRAYLAEQLPQYMVPGAFVYLDAMPLSPNGKLDRKALPAPDRQAQRQTAYVAPGNDTEQALAAIWADVLGLEPVGIEDNFFALGGDSIRTLQVINLAKERGIDISLEQLYRHGTIRGLATLSGASAMPVVTQSPFALITEHDRALLPGAVEDAYPLSTLQAGMIFHSEYDKAAYHLVDSIELRCELNSQMLQTAIRQTVNRHPVLRTAFDMGGYSEPLQLVFSADKVFAEITVEDWRDLSAELQQQQFKLWLEMEKSSSFIITQAPLIRFHIHRFSDDRFRFTVTEHHAILDGWSLVAMLNEIFKRYTALIKGHAETMESVPANALRDLVDWERRAIQSEPHRRYWRQKLADARHSTLPSGINGQTG